MLNAEDRVLSLKTVPSEMWKAQYSLPSNSLPVRQAVLGLPHSQRYSFELVQKIQARESPENTKEKTRAGL
jgi:hypothetical protein